MAPEVPPSAALLTGEGPESDAGDVGKLPRRTFLKMVGATGALAALEGSAQLWPLHAQAIAHRRNIILFTTDQQLELGWFPEGWEEANLPALTKLRNSGVSFKRAYCNTAMCTPSRATLFTGLYPAQHKSYDTLSEGMTQSEQEHQLEPTIPNIATVLKDAGYDVVWKGKWHLSKGLEFDDGSHKDDDIARYGMDGWNSPDAGGDAKIINYGGGTTDHDGRFLDGSTWQDPVGGDIFSQADGPIDPEHEANSVLAYLRDKINNPGSRPFCLIVCLINPHDVLGYPGVSQANGGNGTYTEGGFAPEWIDPTWPIHQQISLPPTVNENLLTNFKPSCQASFLAANAVGLGAVPTPQHKLNYINFYANLVKLNDRRLMQALDLLEGNDASVDATKAKYLHENSWVIFTSDHGDLTMNHGGLRQKSFTFYEETAHVPMVWSNPVDFPMGRVCDELVSHVDFLPTLCAMVGINSNRYRFRGVDYSSLVRNPEGPPVQNELLFTFDDIYSGQDSRGQTNGILPPPNRLHGIQEKNYKYTLYYDGEGVAAPQEEFYDLRSAADGGTDVDPESGRAIEYKNLSAWAENLRQAANQPTLATPELIRERRRLERRLRRLTATKLRSLPKRRAVAPQDFRVELLNWTDTYGVRQSALQITWLSRVSTKYQLQYSLDQQNWTNVGAPVTGNNGPMLISQPLSTNKGFYRIVWNRS